MLTTRPLRTSEGNREGTCTHECHRTMLLLWIIEFLCDVLEEPVFSLSTTSAVEERNQMASSTDPDPITPTQMP